MERYMKELELDERDLMDRNYCYQQTTPAVPARDQHEKKKFSQQLNESYFLRFLGGLLTNFLPRPVSNPP